MNIIHIESFLKSETFKFTETIMIKTFCEREWQDNNAQTLSEPWKYIVYGN